MTIQYSLIARGTTILCSHQIGAGSFQNVAKQMLVNIPTRNDGKTTYTSDNYKFHTMVENGLVYMCVADSNFGTSQPYGYLAEIKEIFLNGSLATRAQFAVDGELDRDFQQVMAGQMERFSQQRQTGRGGDHLTKLQSQVDEVKDVMSQNIEKVLERGERLEDLMDKTNDLESHANHFMKAARRVHRKMWCSNLKMKLIIAAIVTVVILILVLVILFSTGVLPVKDGGSSPSSPTPAPGPKPTD